MPQDANISWLSNATFRKSFKAWTQKMDERPDVFLGYCSEARSTAQSIHLYLKEKLNLSVMNWDMDFTGGGTVLEEIDRSSRLCTCGIFLFTKDDPLEGDKGHAAPRDNVVFEAGYFIRSKGKERVAIIREEGAKMPADLGGNIYIHLSNKDNTASIEGQLKDFLERRL
jgi:predicted nucleotide-binding protein